MEKPTEINREESPELGKRADSDERNLQSWENLLTMREEFPTSGKRADNNREESPALGKGIDNNNTHTSMLGLKLDLGHFNLFSL